MYVLNNLTIRAVWDTRSVFQRSLTGLNSQFSFSYTGCLTKAKEPSLPYYLPADGGKIIAYIPFPKLLTLCEMQTASTVIWTRVTVSIFYDDSNDPTAQWLCVCVCVCFRVYGCVLTWVSIYVWRCVYECVCSCQNEQIRISIVFWEKSVTV